MPDVAVVFGGSGFIGSHLLSRLVDEPRYGAVVSIDRVPPRRPIAGVRYVEHDILDGVPPRLVDDQVETIFNLAALHRTPGHADWEYFSANLGGATEVCRFASATEAREIVFTSSIAVYGNSETRKDDRAPEQPTSAYGRSKLQAERLHSLWRSEQPRERRLTIVRPGAIYGRGESGNFTRLARLLEQRRFVYPGRKDTVKACGYVKDLVASMLFMLRRGESRISYNFCHPQPLTIEEICAAFCHAKGYDLPRHVLPPSLALAGARAAEFTAFLGIKHAVSRDRLIKLLQSTDIMPRQLQEAGFNFQFDLRRSLADWLAESEEGRFA
ncbi:NAD(P)-dependent oxidoreductase [Kaistia dalseonensis]|uniref:Nucleoside-diphosphate-sugar epimerase n=1 Tax=Kaistia dalseonensis TaxID=410840 RepID=A0ABU0HEL7_9HYPH|nr:NAD(P)-dependent oxidoreductase [Kaistia dalseonensis]MCX5497545.1 NAD(P)-dependent oxidoreductase [Kaistia dalseonensis]MDQ0440185.1 nucleoside-diphosphate-sugar epimerase [Kaistia dalseonensis]